MVWLVFLWSSVDDSTSGNLGLSVIVDMLVVIGSDVKDIANGGRKA